MQDTVMLPDCTRLFIGGEWQAAAVAASFTNENPANRRSLGEVAIAGPADVDAAVSAARAALAGKE